MSIMDAFELVKETGIRELLRRSSNAFFAVDTFPEWVFSLYLYLVKPFMKNIPP